MRVITACLSLSIALIVRGVAAQSWGGPPHQGQGAQYWRQHSVIYAVVLSTNRSLERGFGIVVRPFGTLSGTYDAGETAELPIVPVDLAPTLVLGNDKERTPEKGDKAVIVLAEYGDRKGAFGSGWRVDFMPGSWHQPLRLVNGFSDLEVKSILEAVRELRKDERADEPALTSLRAEHPFWSVHSLVYGRIRGTTQTGGRIPSLSVDFEPELTLSGGFDCGKASRVTLPADPPLFAAPRKPLPVAARSLVLVVHKDKSWAVASEQPRFMPGDHAPICEVKDFDDPKVADTLKAIRESRKNEKKTESTNTKSSNANKASVGSSEKP